MRGEYIDMTYDKYIEKILFRLKNEELCNLANFIVTNFHHCPFPDDCGIDFEKQCIQWGSSNCIDCLMKYNDKLNIKSAVIE